MDKFYIIGACVLAIGSVCIQLSNGATTSFPPVTTGSQTEVTDGATTSSHPVTTGSQTHATDGATTSSPPVTTGSQTQATDGATISSPSVTTGSQTQVTDGATITSGITVSTPPSVTDVITDVLNNATCPRFTSRLENDTLYVSYVEGRCEMVVTVDKISLPPLKLVSLLRRRNRVIRRPAVSFRPVVMEENGEPVTCESLPTRSLGPFVFVDSVMDVCQVLLKIQKQKNEAFTPRVPGQNRPGKQEGKRPREPRFTFLPALEYLDEVIY
ncbi:mucin-3A-like [Mizuhopecten yessoensis]|uniref:mucin-3A-like n=1 Tax=Mizuhopecten yessoensis TaxID=6573 RepID=UPI000B457EA3|nr:mucin-3A-like [Mizuhopecten yessoensis]